MVRMEIWTSRTTADESVKSGHLKSRLLGSKLAAGLQRRAAVCPLLAIVFHHLSDLPHGNGIACNLVRLTGSLVDIAWNSRLWHLARPLDLVRAP